MKNHLRHSENVQNFMRTHQFMGIPGVQAGNGLTLKGLQKIQTFQKQRLTFDASAVILHRFGNRPVKFFPVSALLLVCGQRRQKPFLFPCSLFRIIGQKLRPGAVCGSFPSGIITGRAGKARAVGGVKLIAGRIDSVNVCFQIPVV